MGVRSRSFLDSQHWCLMFKQCAGRDARIFCDLDNGVLAPRRNIGLPLGSEDDAGVGVVEAVLCQPHEGGVLLHQQDEHRVAADLSHLRPASSHSP